MSTMGFMGFLEKPEHRLIAAQAAVRNTAFGGKNNLVKVELDPTTEKVVFIVNATGERVNSVEEAFTRANSFMLTQFNEIKPVSGSVRALGKLGASGSIETRNPTQLAAVGEILQRIQENMRRADPKSLALLEKMGFTKEEITTKELSLNLATTKNQRGIKLEDQIKRLRERGHEFIPIVDKDGATLMQFKIGGRSLTEAESFMLLSTVGNPMLRREELYAKMIAGDITTGDLDMSTKGLSSFMSKLGKRVRGLVGERDLTLTLDDMTGSYDIIDKRKSS